MSGSKVDAKVVLLGKEYGGKTSLVERYLHNKFSGDLPYQNTIGAAYGAKRTEVCGKKVVLGIWDTAGSERYQAMSRIYYRNAWAAVVCFDLTEAVSWEKAVFWAAEIRQQEPNARLYFAATKKDLVDDEPRRRQVDHHNVMDVARKYQQAPVFETSSKTGENVVEIFTQIATDFVLQNKGKISQMGSSDSYVTLNVPKDKQKSFCACYK